MIGSYVQYALLASVLGWDKWWLALPARHGCRSSSSGWWSSASCSGPCTLGGSRAARRVRDHHHHRPHGPLPESRHRHRRAEPVLARRTTRGPPPSSPCPSPAIAWSRSSAPWCSCLLFYVLTRKTWVGRAFRGAAQNRVGIQTAGVDVLRLDMLAFGVGVALAAPPRARSSPRTFSSSPRTARSPPSRASRSSSSAGSARSSAAWSAGSSSA